MRESQNHIFTTHDGVELLYRHWPATTPTAGPRQAVVMFHRGHEHGGRMAHLPGELDLPEFDFFAWDARGHGQSPGARGDSPGFATSVRDVQTFIEHIQTHHGIAEHDMVGLARVVGCDREDLGDMLAELKQLEQLVESLESGDVSLDALVAKYEEGMRLLKSCQKSLEAAELRIEQLGKRGEDSQG